MKRNIAILILIVYCSIFQVIVDDYKQITTAQDNILENQSSIDYSPIQNGKNDKVSHITVLATTIIIILIVHQTATFLLVIAKRLKLLTPVFYQSNYVITVPLNK
ncbi:hypothetical protein ACFSTA_17780 [Ornithinibacillus salinisoli]|uniref:Uncharacterized protein n=1 Tax=Ornithinibacillus salinisoli TaxID=1848459 RepID=A0ABW4W4N1_9BACI